MRQCLLGALPPLALAACGLAPYDLPNGVSDPLTGLGPRVDSTYEEPGSSTTATAATSTSGGAVEPGAETSEGEGGAEGSGPGFDLGTPPEFEPMLPAGCAERKVDFLFLTSRLHTMAGEQPQLASSLPGFSDIIEQKFAGYDRHVLVANPDGAWGSDHCDDEGCAAEGVCPEIPAYPCGAVDDTTACDWTLGAGIVYPAGDHATNHACPLVAGRRYVVEEHPQKGAAFECLAQTGYGGALPREGDALIAALSPEMNGPQGCNAGFLRDDALLVITFISDTEDLSETGPQEWYDALLTARRGDLRSVVLLGVINDIGQPNAKCPGWEDDVPAIPQFLDMVPLRVHESTCAPSYAPAFALATDMVLKTCLDALPE